MKCACGERTVHKKNLKFNGYDIDGWLCDNCGEVYYDPEKAQRILLLNKLKNTY